MKLGSVDVYCIGCADETGQPLKLVFLQMLSTRQHHRERRNMKDREQVPNRNTHSSHSHFSKSSFAESLSMRKSFKETVLMEWGLAPRRPLC